MFQARLELGLEKKGSGFIYTGTKAGIVLCSTKSGILLCSTTAGIVLCSTVPHSHPRCVDMVITELGVFELRNGAMVLTEIGG